MDGDADGLHPLVLGFGPQTSPCRHDLRKEPQTRVSSLAEGEIRSVSVLLDMLDHVVGLPPRRVEHLDVALPVGEDIEAVGLCEAIEPVGSAECADRCVVDFVHPGAGAVEGADCPRRDATSDGDLDGSSLLSEAIKLHE